MPESPWSNAADGELLDACRSGDTDAFAALWERHRHAAHAAARGLARTLDPDDLVSEAYLKIFELVLDGRGPRGAFRPYLYQVIRSTAVDRYRSPEHASAELDEIPDLHEIGPWEDNAFDLNAVTEAFSSLDERWQAALWYAEVEGLPPRQAAPLLGLSANAVSALTARAREGLQSAWVAAHVNRELAQAECETTLERLQRHQLGKLTARATRAVESHLETCDTCRAASVESSLLNRRLGLILAGVFLGGTGAAALLSELGLAPAVGVAVAAGAAGTPSGAATSASGAAGSTGATASTVAAGGITALPIAVISGFAVAVAAVVGIGAVVIAHHSGDTEFDSAQVDVDALDQIDAPRASTATAGASPRATARGLADGPHRQPESDPGPQPPAPRPDPPQPDPPRPQPPIPPRPEHPNPGPPTPPDDDGDASLTPGFTCLAPQITGTDPVGNYLVGEANAYGLLNVRITRHGATPVAIFAPRFDPAREGTAPGNVFVNGIFADNYGNSFHTGFFTGTDPAPQPVWFGDTSLTPLSQWPGLVDEPLNSVIVEIRLTTPDGRSSPWVEIDTTGPPCF